MPPGALPALRCMHPQENCQEGTRVSLNTERKEAHQLVWQRRWTQLLCTGLWGLRLKAAPVSLRREQQSLLRRLGLISDCLYTFRPLLSSLPPGPHLPPQCSPQLSRAAENHSFHLALQPGPIFSFPHVPKHGGSRK